MTALRERVIEHVGLHPGETIDEIARAVRHRTVEVRDVLLGPGFSSTLRLAYPSDRARVYELARNAADGPGRAKRPSQDELVQCAGVLARSGKNIDEIREALDCSLRSAWRYVRAAGVRPAPRPTDREGIAWRRAVDLVIAGSTRKTAYGYLAVYLPMHSSATSRGEVLEHRLVMERHLGRFLREDELVHHVNEEKTDNRIENLEVVSIQEHQQIHAFRKLSSFGPDLVDPKTQTGKVLAALRQLGGKGTAAELHRIVGPLRLNSRIAELRSRGHVIVCHHIDGLVTGPHAYQYELLSSPSIGTSEAGEDPLPSSSASDASSRGLRGGIVCAASDSEQLQLGAAA